MELVATYLKSSRSYQVVHAVNLWNERKVKATPDMAAFIENECGITRHNFDAKCREVMRSEEEQDPNTTAEAILAFIIYCIDNQEFEAIAEALEGNPLQ
jgi:hypothetical protein